jgi:hypothetical protein
VFLVPDLILQSFPPAKAVFAGFAILLGVSDHPRISSHAFILMTCIYAN